MLKERQCVKCNRSFAWKKKTFNQEGERWIEYEMIKNRALWRLSCSRQKGSNFLRTIHTFLFVLTIGFGSYFIVNRPSSLRVSMWTQLLLRIFHIIEFVKDTYLLHENAWFQFEKNYKDYLYINKNK